MKRRLVLVFALACSLGAQTCLVWAPPAFVDAEVPAGARDGVNRVYTLAHTPATGSTPLVALNGIVQRMAANQDFTLAGKQITFTAAAAIPQSGSDNLLVWYRWQP